MDDKDRIKKIEAMQAIKTRAEKMLNDGKDPFVVRGFVDDAKTELAFKLPDKEAFEKATQVAAKYKNQKEASIGEGNIKKNQDFT
tara:strand:+ start:39 stop:293 length:255 start_codon:yes stop_codon:yes gene_type:complete